LTLVLAVKHFRDRPATALFGRRAKVLSTPTGRAVGRAVSAPRRGAGGRFCTGRGPMLRDVYGPGAGGRFYTGRGPMLRVEDGRCSARAGGPCYGWGAVGEAKVLPEEPYAVILRVRICGSPGRATARGHPAQGPLSCQCRTCPVFFERLPPGRPAGQETPLSGRFVRAARPSTTPPPS
jgi:hypothetical protein